jgi:peptidoglycan/LPS O-acetylase OafA/YrhL
MGGRFSFPIYVWHVPIQQITLPITQEISNNRNSIEFNLIFFITTLGFSIWASKISNYVVKNLLSKL